MRTAERAALVRESFQVTSDVDSVVAIVELNVSSINLEVGEEFQLVAVTKNASGVEIPGQEVIWSSGEDLIASVDSNGLVLAVDNGSTFITGTCNGIGASAGVTVAAPSVPTTITVSPSSFSLNVGSTRTLVATVKDQYGSVMNGQTVTWTSNTPANASVDSSTGTVTGNQAGAATITATLGEITGNSSVTVVTVSITLTPTLDPKTLYIPIDGVARLEVNLARVEDATGKLAAAKDGGPFEDMAGHPITVESSSPGVATAEVEDEAHLPNRSVIVRAVSQGTTTITVSYDGGAYTKTMTLIVDNTIAAAPTTLAEGTVDHLNAPVTWDSWTDSDGDFYNFAAFYETDGSSPTKTSRCVIIAKLPTATSATIRLGEPNTLHKVAIAAIDKAGNVGTLSNVVEITTGDREAFNEPVGYTTIFSNDGTAVPPGRVEDARLAVVDDIESPSGKAVEWRWTNSNVDGNTGNWDDPPGRSQVYSKQDNGPFGSATVSEAYFRLIMKHNHKWIHQPGGDKLSYFGQDQTPSAMFPNLRAAQGSLCEPYGLGFQNQSPLFGSTRFVSVSDEVAQIYPGGYHIYEFKLVAQSGAVDSVSGQYLADGALYIYHNGVERLAKTDFQWVKSGERGFKKFEWGPFWGGGGWDAAGTNDPPYAHFYKHTLGTYLPIDDYDWVRFAEFYMSGKA